MKCTTKARFPLLCSGPFKGLRRPRFQVNLTLLISVAWLSQLMSAVHARTEMTDRAVGQRRGKFDQSRIDTGSVTCLCLNMFET